MIEDVIQKCDFQLNGKADYKTALILEEAKDVRKIARLITNAENGVTETTSNTKDNKNDPGTWNYRNRWCGKIFSNR